MGGVLSRAPRRDAIGAFTNRGCAPCATPLEFMRLNLSLFLRLSALLEGKVEDPWGTWLGKGKEGGFERFLS